MRDVESAVARATNPELPDDPEERAVVVEQDKWLMAVIRCWPVNLGDLHEARNGGYRHSAAYWRWWRANRA